MQVMLLKAGCKHCCAAVVLNLSVTLVVVVPRLTGLGDLVAEVIHFLTRIKPCAACDRRRKWLNRKVPFIGHALRAAIALAKGDSYPLTLDCSASFAQTLQREVTSVR